MEEIVAWRVVDREDTINAEPFIWGSMWSAEYTVNIEAKATNA